MPQKLTDNSGKIIWANYEFAWGGWYIHFYKEQSLNNCDILEHELQPIRFQGQFYDVETGLHYNRFRYYDTDVGMFIQRDPIGLLGGNNVFQYAPNPIHWVDPWGLIHKNSKDYEGPFVLYAIWDSPEKKELLKIGKADAIRVKKSKLLFGKNGRMHDSERLAKKLYPTAYAEIIQDLGVMTTGKAEAREARLVRALRKKAFLFH